MVNVIQNVVNCVEPLLLKYKISICHGRSDSGAEYDIKIKKGSYIASGVIDLNALSNSSETKFQEVTLTLIRNCLGGLK